MWKSRTRKGFSLIETSCSIFLFTVLFFSAAAIGLASVKIKGQAREMRELSELLEIVHDSLEFNASYDDVKRLKDENRLYINKNNFQYNAIKEREVVCLFESDSEAAGRRLYMTVEGDKVFKITLYLSNDSRYSTEPLILGFYKGSYR